MVNFSDNDEDLENQLGDLAMQFEDAKDSELGRLRDAAHQIASYVQKLSWSEETMRTAFFALSKSSRIDDGPDIVLLAAGICTHVKSAELAYQILIAVDDYLEFSSTRCVTKRVAVVLASHIEAYPTLWGRHVDLREFVTRALRNAATSTTE